MYRTFRFLSCYPFSSLLLTDGFPVTMVGRLSPAFDEPCPPDTRLSWQRLVERRVTSRSQRPVIQLKPERRYAAMQMANVLRANEAIAMAIDSPPLVADRQRAVPIEFLGQQVLLLSGCITLARLTGTSILMVFLHRSPDWRHQVLEILPPLAMDSDVEATFEQCMTTVETAILQQPAHWLYWDRTDDLVDLGLMPTTKL